MKDENDPKTKNTNSIFAAPKPDSASFGSTARALQDFKRADSLSKNNLTTVDSLNKDISPEPQPQPQPSNKII